MRSALQILGFFEDEDIAWMIDYGYKKIFSKGENVIANGQNVKELYMVLDGVLNVETPEGKVVTQLQQGDILGEMSFVEDKTPNVDVNCSEDTKLLCLAHEALRAYFKNCPYFEARFYKAISLFLSGRLRSVQDHFNSFFISSSDEPAISEEYKFFQNKSCDDECLDHLHIAGERFNKIISHFQ